MPEKNDIVLTPEHGRSLSLDIYWPETEGVLPLILFCHGFKGFKDWGHWSQIAHAFNEAGFAFVAMNFSHNGTTPEHPERFVDLEAFGKNNYSKELEDIRTVVEWLDEQFENTTGYGIDPDCFALCGHSRGGGTAIIYAAEDDRITHLVTWASVDSLDYSWQSPDLIEEWKEEGVYHIENARTGQKMPIYYQMYEDYKAHEDEYDTQKALNNIDIPYLIIHGGDDPGVSPKSAEKLHSWADDSKLSIIENTGHVFGGGHPWEKNQIPEPSRQLVDETVRFLKEN